MDPEEILQLLDARGISQSELARRIDLDQDKLNKSLRGKRKISVKEMEAIKAVLIQEHAQPTRSIPVIGQISAGNWREAIQHPIDAIPMPDSSIPPRAFGLRVSGDSMDLLVDDGALIIVDPDDRVLFNDRYYAVLNADGEATFKQFKTDPARLAPCSTNPAHREIVLGDEFYEVIGRIIWRASRM
jgi:repressor LexA